MKSIALALILWAATATVQAYGDCTVPYVDGFGRGEPWMTMQDHGCEIERSRQETDRIYETRRQRDREREELAYRDRMLQLQEQAELREISHEMERQRLRECAPYNRGCAQELYGGGY